MLLLVFILIIAAAINLILCCVAGNKAVDKGRSFAAWFCLGFFLLGGLIDLIIISCVADLNQNNNYPTYNANNFHNSTNTCYDGQKAQSFEKSEVDMWCCNHCNRVNNGGTYCKTCGKERGSRV